MFGEFATGQPVSGLSSVDQQEAALFYANLRRDKQGMPTTCGGRVLHVVGAGRSLEQARDKAYGQIERITFPGMRYRTDIGASPRPVKPQPSFAQPLVTASFDPIFSGR